MTVWVITDNGRVITDNGNEIVGLFDSYDTAMASINFSYHKLSVKIEVRPTWKDQLYRNDWQVSVEVFKSNDVRELDRVEHFRLYEEPLHSSKVHL